MLTIELPGAGGRASSLGFGCASLGSRISARQGLAALSRAKEAGITWFDVAPAYGAGDAEPILADFLAARREGVRVLTKVGLAPPAHAPLLKLAHAALRPVAGLARNARRALRGVAANTAQTLTPELIRTSIEASLARLRVDHVDALALHDPDPDAVTRDDVLRALERVLARGQARYVGVAGSRTACLAGAAPGLPYRVFQTAVWREDDDFADIRAVAKRPVLTIGHSVLSSGAPGAARKIEAALRANAAGVTLLSMFSRDHLDVALACAARVEAGPASFAKPAA